MFDVVAFGEIMLRLSPPGYQKITQAVNFDINYGGAEANTLVALSNLGVKSSFITVLPDNSITDAALGYLNKNGIDTSFVKRKGNRIGIYFLEKGVGIRGSSVIYDRANSAINEIADGDIDWDYIFSKTKIFYFTGITPALSSNVLNQLKIACEKAKKNDVKIAFDINYRAKLWSYEKAHEVIDKLVTEYVDILITNEEHIRKVLKINIESNYFNGNDLNEEGQKRLYKLAKERYQKVDKLILAARRTISASRNIFWAYTFNDGQFINSNKLEFDIIDRVGGGDAFTAGILYGLINQKPIDWTLNFGVAMCALKHTIEGDAAIFKLNEITSVMSDDYSTMMKR